MTTRTPNVQLSALVAESGLTYEALAPSAWPKSPPSAT